MRPRSDYVEWYPDDTGHNPLPFDRSWLLFLRSLASIMVRTEAYKPKTNHFGLDVAMFERYFGYKVQGDKDPHSGKRALHLRLVSSHVLHRSFAPWVSSPDRILFLLRDSIC